MRMLLAGAYRVDGGGAGRPAAGNVVTPGVPRASLDGSAPSTTMLRWLPTGLSGLTSRPLNLSAKGIPSHIGGHIRP